jgi:curved DNA-binding protein CbpA
MPSAARPDLFAFMDAYTVLGVDYSANSSVIRQAYKRLAKQHHPDKHPAGSAEHQQATTRMAQINDAYRLIRDAPLRHHRVSKGSDPITPWTDDELDDAIRRARMSQQFDRWMTVALVVVAVIVVPSIVGTVAAFNALGSLTWPFTGVVGLGSTIFLYTVLGPRAWRTLYRED